MTAQLNHEYGHGGKRTSFQADIYFLQDESSERKKKKKKAFERPRQVSISISTGLGQDFKITELQPILNLLKVAQQQE